MTVIHQAIEVGVAVIYQAIEVRVAQMTNIRNTHISF